MSALEVTEVEDATFGGETSSAESYGTEKASRDAIQKPIPRTEAEPEGGFFHMLKGMASPELYDLAKALLGRPPEVYRKFRGTLGMFRYPNLPGDPENVDFIRNNIRILINPSLGKNADALARVLAHEIGHLIDYLPDLPHTLSRGNILSRIASLRKHMPHTIAAHPGGADPMTPNDRKALRKEAERQVNEMGIKDKEERNAARKAITKALIDAEVESRGLLSADEIRQELISLTKWWSGDYEEASAKHKEYRESSKELYAEAISVFLNTPGELKARAPKFWEGLVNYIDRKTEVLDNYLAIQELMSSDTELGRKRTEATLKMFGKTDQKIMASATSRVAADNSIWETIRQQLEHFIIQADRWIANKFALTLKEIKKVIKKGKAGQITKRAMEAAETCMYILDELFTIDSTNHKMLRDIDRNIFTPLLAAGISRNDFGEYLYLERIANGDRDDKINPQGYDAPAAREQLKFTAARLGESNYALVQQFGERFHDIVFEIVTRAVEAGVYNRQMYKDEIVPNKDFYAAFGVTKYVSDYVGPEIRKQIGTFEDIANPFDYTIMKMLSLNRLIELNKAKRSVVQFFLEHFDERSIRKAKVPYRQSKPSETLKKGFKWLMVLEDGHYAAYEVEAHVVTIFQQHDIGGLAPIASVLQSGTYRAFHPVLVQYNPGFIAANPFRDFKRTAVNLGTLGAMLNKEKIRELMADGMSRSEAKKRATKQKITLKDVIKQYAKGLPVGIARGNSQFRISKGAARIDIPLVDEMMDAKALDVPWVTIDHQLDEQISVRDLSRGRFGSEKKSSLRMRGPLEQMLENAGLRAEEKKGKREKRIQNWPLETGRAINLIGDFFNAVEGLGVAQETTAKVAAWKLLEERGVPVQRRAYLVRKHAGTPDYKARGLATALTNGTFMYSKVAFNGLKADSSLAFGRDTAFSWWWRTFLWNIMPTALSKSAKYGAFGSAAYLAFRHIPDVFLTNYTIIPVGWLVQAAGESAGFLDPEDEDDQAEHPMVFISIPRDESGKLISNVFGSMMDVAAEAMGGNTEHGTAQSAAHDLFGDVTGAILPSLSPPIELTIKWTAYASGHNPDDPFYGTKIVPPNDFKSEGWISTRPMVSWSLSKFGAIDTFVHPITGPLLGETFSGEDETYTQTTIRSMPGFNRLIRVSDRGITEAEWGRLRENERDDARFRSDLPKSARERTTTMYRLQQIQSDLSDHKKDKLLLHRHWYGQSYLPITREMKQAEADGDTGTYERKKQQLADDAGNLEKYEGDIRDRMRKIMRRTRPKPGTEEYYDRLRKWRSDRDKAREWLDRH